MPSFMYLAKDIFKFIVIAILMIALGVMLNLTFMAIMHVLFGWFSI